MLQISQQKQAAGRSRTAAITCLEQLTKQFISTTQPSHSQHRLVAQQFLPDCATLHTRLASWPVADVALLARVMETYAWCDARVWSQIQDITLCEAPLVMPVHAANLLHAASRWEDIIIIIIIIINFESTNMYTRTCSMYTNILELLTAIGCYSMLLVLRVLSLLNYSLGQAVSMAVQLT
jgi:hypothetical protein